MRRLLVVISISLLTIVLRSQDYIPFNLEKGEWVCNYITKYGGFFGSYGCNYAKENVKYYCDGDTIINDTIFKKLYYKGFANCSNLPDSNISGYFGSIRNDIINKRVWLRTPYKYDILYDFNLKVGDKNFVGRVNTEDSIISIDSVLICNKYHKRYNANDGLYIVEGVGSRYGLIPNVYITDNSALICYSVKNSLVCDSCLTPTVINGLVDFDELSIIPDAENGVLIVKSSKTISSIEIFDISGRIVNSFSEINMEETQLSILQKGIFIIRISMSNIIVSRKVVIK